MTNFFKYPRIWIETAKLQEIDNNNGVIIYYNDPERSKIIELIKKIKTEVEMILEYNEAYQIYMAVQKVKKIEGDIAEVGTFRGVSAKLISEAENKKKIHIFDTFEGLPKLSRFDDSDHFFQGQFSSSLNDVKAYLKNYKNVYFYKGLFPLTSDPVKKVKFSFVHLDLDLYQATLDSIIFFYPRMNKGGMMISHDYINSPGVRKAFDDFFQDKPESVIEMSGTQCLIVKL